MDSNNQEFVEANRDFILKLKIKATDGSNQIRRVRLPRIVDSSGLISYDELVGLCVTFTFPQDSPDNYQVSLTYFDVDEDTVTIASTHELVDAIEQFADKKVLRVTTEVKPRSPGTGARAPDTATSTSNDSPTVPPQMKNVLESFVGVLSTAVTHLQEGLNSPDVASPAVAPRPATQGGGIVPPPEVVTASTQVASTQAPSPESDEAEAQEPEEIPFIHGRHTCDSCLVTPIVGKRFHATNLPDYDLCQKCHENYKGVEVKFEPVELDRDRAFQTRWQRRHQKIKRFQARQANKSNRSRGLRRYRRVGGNAASRPQPAPVPETVSMAPPPPQAGVLPPFAPPPPPMPPCVPPHELPHVHHHVNMHGHPHGPHRLHLPHGPPYGHPFRHHMPPHGPPHWANIQAGSPEMGAIANEYDSALKEAVRRSLEDFAAGEVQAEKELNDDTTGMCDDEKGATETSEPAEIDLTDEDEDAVEAASVEPEEKAEQCLEVQPDETKAMEEAMETGSVDSEKLLEEDDRKPAAVDRETSSPADINKDESFQSEAVGSGEVAEAVGATLDLVSSMICEMLSEADIPTKKPAPKSSEEVETAVQKPAEDSAPDFAAQEKETQEIVEGALIMENNETSDGDSIIAKEEENDWEVVGADENIARAAEMLGSVLFNSEVKSPEDSHSEANISTLSDSFSVPSAVPSINVGLPQRERWVGQLSKLRELGFDDEAQCVEILERLQAANIGADEDDEISVTKVVNEILEQK